MITEKKQTQSIKNYLDHMLNYKKIRKKAMEEKLKINDSEKH